jgi:hypothetical protein
MEKASRIKIGDLPEKQKITHEEMRKITGGARWTTIFGRWEVGSVPDGKSDMDDSWFYVYDYVTGEVTYY